MEKIELSNGYAMVKLFLDRKTARLQRKIMYEGTKVIPVIDEKTGKQKVDENGNPMTRIEMDATRMDESNDPLVLGFLTKLVLDEKDMPLTQESLDSMKNEDFEKILVSIKNISLKKEEEKKS